jgi:hypothetical protein
MPRKPQAAALDTTLDTTMDPREPGSRLEEWPTRIIAERVDENLKNIMSLAILMSGDRDPAGDSHMRRAAAMILDVAGEARELHAQLSERL